MPLKSGKTADIINKNMEELVGNYKKTGKIGTSTPPSIVAAQKQAAAIAYNKAGEGEEKPWHREEQTPSDSGIHWKKTIKLKDSKINKIANKFITPEIKEILKKIT